MPLAYLRTPIQHENFQDIPYNWQLSISEKLSDMDTNPQLQTNFILYTPFFLINLLRLPKQSNAVVQIREGDMPSS